MIRRLASGASVLAIGQVAGQTFVFARNIIIVRTLTIDDYGVAATFMIAVAFLQASTNLNIGKLLVQAPDGEEPVFQRAAHVMRFAQGAFVSAVLLSLAPSMAAMFSAPAALPAYQALAVIPLIHGLTHFDINRYQRAGNFRPMVLVNCGSQLASLLVVAALAARVQSYSLVVWSLVAIPTASVLISHLLAERPYRWALEGRFGRRVFAYGWPLLLNGFFMVMISEGDRALLGSSKMLNRAFGEGLQESLAAIGGLETFAALDKADLAVYSLALSLAIIPTRFLNQTLGTILFPAMSRRQGDPAALRDSFVSAGTVFAVSGAMVASAFVVGGGPLIVFIYGEPYRAADLVIALLGTTQAIRLVRLAATTLALAVADTQIALYANIARAVSLVGTTIVVLGHLELAWIAAATVAAEALALSVSLLLLHVRQGMHIGLLVAPTLFGATVIGGAFALRGAGFVDGDLARIVVAGLYAAGVLGAAALLLPKFRPGLRELLAGRAPAGGNGRAVSADEID